MFTKPPTPGRVKTRLIGPLTEQEAADLHSALVADLLAQVQDRAFDLVVTFGLGSDETLPADWPRPGLCCWRQRGRNLGERLFEGLSRAAETWDMVAAVGSDHPGLTGLRVEEAFLRLEDSADVVLGPAEDGGYYLIAVRAAVLRAALFEGIEWSTSSVLEQTRTRCRSAGLATSLLDPASDVDDAADLARLEDSIRAGAIDAPRVAALLERWRLNEAAL